MVVESEPVRPAPVARLEWAALLGVMLGAALLRFWDLGQLPPGIHVDEAFNLLDARRVLAGWRPIFLPDNAGREVLYTYLQAPLLGLFGESIGVARATSALAGTLSIPIFWVVTRVLVAGDPGLDARAVRRVALLTAGLTAFSYWHLHFSRFGIRAILFPALVSGLVWAWWRLVDDLGARASGAPWRRVLPVALLLGLAFYTHPAGRGLVALPIAHAAWLAWRRRDRRPLTALAASLAGMLLVAAPLLVFWARHPQTFTSHAEETSILGQGPAALAANLAKVAGMFFVAGDPAPWRNLPGRPVLGWLWPIDPAQLPLTLLLAACLLLGLWRLRRAAGAGQSWAALLLCWLAVLLVPTAVTDAAPNFSRAIGILPLPALLVALGLEQMQRPLWRARPALAEGWRPASLALAVLVLSLAATTTDYFGRFALGPESPLAFDDDKVALGKLVRAEREAGAAVYLSPEMAAHPTVRFVAGEPVAGFDLAQGLVLPPSLHVERALYLGAAGAGAPDPGPVLASLAQRLDLSRYRQQGPGLLPGGRRYTIEGLRVEPESGSPANAWRLGGPIGVEFDGFIGLLDWRCGECPPSARGEEGQLIPGARLGMHLTWQARRPTETDLNLSLQLVTEAGAGITQIDGPPLGGGHPSDVWQPGEIVITRQVLTIPEDAPAGPAILRVGWYDWRSGAPLTDAQGRSVVEIARFEILP